MSIDILIKYILLPLLQYPSILFVPFREIPQTVKIISIFYSVCLNVFLSINSWYKCYGARDWKKLSDYNNAVVVITGGSNGLGKAIVYRLFSKYPNITIVNIDLQELKMENKRLVQLKCNLGNDTELNDAIKSIKQLYSGQIRMIINNAGVRSSFKNFDEVDILDFENICAVNTMAPIKLIQALVPKASETNLHSQCYIVNIASTLGIVTPAKVTSYAVSKAALIAFHQSYGFELMTKNRSDIRLLLVTPGQLNTGMFSGFEPPRQFFAPVLDVDNLAEKILQCSERGERGSINEPFYAYFAHMLMSMPFSIQIMLRKLSKMDECLPDGK
ncbi:hypothetical protein KAFR_0A05630 [Kazachstania africana CBS 2517]|uniref:NAD(P)-binding protein n=1 Tax=Kazachstania africana (strain ATCC 22294 / BCRC 22015 / CBS 2517 / CECT 1963 / NBRC 1671 / NRRL Y-8276) TaxID=1071382 RepID=H2ANP8_KAZAF|nr:hypothetical protein KAFR_0A05630 [Kazachstania africana CBS 2517]CCF55998.1 hypothetical protein KAFR_0A05630 [Kazachstania africana CBS 2517]